MLNFLLLLLDAGNRFGFLATLLRRIRNAIFHAVSTDCFLLVLTHGIENALRDLLVRRRRFQDVVAFVRRLGSFFVGCGVSILDHGSLPFTTINLDIDSRLEHHLRLITAIVESIVLDDLYLDGAFMSFVCDFAAAASAETGSVLAVGHVIVPRVTLLLELFLWRVLQDR